MKDIQLVLILFALGLAGLTGYAATPDRDWPSVVVTPALDVPMRNPAITLGPDGACCLTGMMGISTL